MTSTTFFFVFIPLLAIILLAVNLIFAPHNPYQEKDSAFECGFHSFLGQNRTQFSISFFIFALLFLLFDLEILLVYPYVVSAYTNGIYGLTIMLIFFLALTLGFAFELGKNALKIDSRQMLNLSNFKISTISHISSFKFSIHRIIVKYPLAIFYSIIFIVSLLTMVIFYIDINIFTLYLDFFTILACGLLSWTLNNGFMGWLSECLGIKGNFNLSHLLLDRYTMVLSEKPLIGSTKPGFMTTPSANPSTSGSAGNNPSTSGSAGNEPIVDTYKASILTEIFKVKTYTFLDGLYVIPDPNGVASRGFINPVTKRPYEFSGSKEYTEALVAAKLNAYTFNRPLDTSFSLTDNKYYEDLKTYSLEQNAANKEIEPANKKRKRSS